MRTSGRSDVRTGFGSYLVGSYSECGNGRRAGSSNVILYHLIFIGKWRHTPPPNSRVAKMWCRLTCFVAIGLAKVCRWCCECCPKMSSKGRIELQIGVSRAKIRKEPAGDVRFCLAPRKPIENCEKLIFRSIFPKFSERVRMHPNASRSIRAHPNASERVQTGPSKSQNVKKLAKTCKNLRKLAKISRKILKKSFAKPLVYPVSS